VPLLCSRIINKLSNITFKERGSKATLRTSQLGTILHHHALIMSRPEDRGVVRRTFTQLFRDAYLEKSHNRIIPFAENNTAQSDLYLIIDLTDSNNTSPQDISKKLILTLLQCAARLYEGDVDAKEEAKNLIKCKEFRTILSVGIQDKLSQDLYEQNIASIRDEGPTAENSINASLLSAKRNNAARQVGSKTTIIENIASLCYSKLNTLQNSCESARIDELFMFGNFTTLVGALSFVEMYWLVVILPSLFQWPDETSGDAKASDHKLVARYGISLPNSVIACPLGEADPAGCGDDRISNHGSVSSLSLSPNFNLSFLDNDDEDDAAEIFRLSPEPWNNSSTNKLPLFHGTGLVSKEFHGDSDPALASPLVNSSKIIFRYEESEQQSAIYPSIDAQIDGELLRLFGDIKLQVGGPYSIHQRLSHLFEDPVLIQGWLKTLQESTIERCNFATTPTLISVFKNVIVAGDRNGSHKEDQILRRS
jgi:hypothetical protein